MGNKEYEQLKEILCCGFLDTAEFVKAFNVTKIAKNRSYQNQGLAVVGDVALKLLLTERGYGAEKSKKEISEQRTAYESDENWIRFCNCFNLQKYRFIENGVKPGMRNLPGSKAVKSAYFEALAGLIYLNSGMEKLIEWYDALIEKHGTELKKYDFIYLKKQ